MRVLITGGRDFQEHDWLFNGLEFLNMMYPIGEIIEGGASGADCLAANWARWKQVKLTTVEAEWTKYGKRAGMIRNCSMADLNPDLVLATPGGRGTAHMVGEAQARGIQVVMLEKMPVRRP